MHATSSSIGEDVQGNGESEEEMIKINKTLRKKGIRTAQIGGGIKQPEKTSIETPEENLMPASVQAPSVDGGSRIKHHPNWIGV